MATKFKASSLASTATEAEAFAYYQGFIKDRYNKEVSSIEELKEIESLNSFRGGLEIGKTYKVKRGCRRDEFAGVPTLFVPLEGGKEVSLTALTDTRNGLPTCVFEFDKGGKKTSRKDEERKGIVPVGVSSLPESELLELLVKDPESLQVTYYGFSWVPWVAKTDGHDSKESWQKGYKRGSKRHYCIVTKRAAN